MAEFVNPFVGMVPPGRKMSDSELLRALRLSLSAEEEAIHIYEAIADAAANALAKAVLKDIAREERVHKGEFQKLIEILSPSEVDTMHEGASEVIQIQNGLSTSGGEPGNEKKIETVGNLKGKTE